MTKEEQSEEQAFTDLEQGKAHTSPHVNRSYIKSRAKEKNNGVDFGDFFSPIPNPPKRKK